MEIQLPYRFVPRSYQVPLWNYMIPETIGQRAVCVWHRRGGKDLMSTNICSVKAFQRVGTYWHVLPTYKQGRNIIWNGMTGDGRRFLDYFPQELVKDTNSTEMRVSFINGSNYFVVGSDNIDSLVGTNPVGVVLSEYSLQDPKAWDYIRPILAENGGWALFIYTPRGHNHGYKIRNIAKRSYEQGSGWFFSELSARTTGAVTEAAIQAEREAGMSEELVNQEFYVSFESPMEGAYYSKQMTWLYDNGRITKVPWEPSIPVNTYWDLGMDDAMTVWFEQQVGMERRFIDYYEASGEGFPHMAKVLEQKDYAYGTHWGPWDLSVREIGTGEARIDTARKLGIKFRTVGKHGILDGIEQVRNLLPKCWFDEEKCDRGIDALKSYRKDRDEKRGVFLNRPLHDWASHGADGFRTCAMSRRPTGNKSMKPQAKAIDSGRYL